MLQVYVCGCLRSRQKPFQDQTMQSLTVTRRHWWRTHYRTIHVIWNSRRTFDKTNTPALTIGSYFFYYIIKQKNENLVDALTHWQEASVDCAEQNIPHSFMLSGAPYTNENHLTTKKSSYRSQKKNIIFLSDTWPFFNPKTVSCLFLISCIPIVLNLLKPKK